MSINWTTEQKQAIFDTDKDILVSAAAGSGKTTILIERVITKIMNGQDVDKLLIVTFTKLAAKEMKDRLISRLRSEINNTTDTIVKLNLQQQLAKVPAADISTLHSFCSNVIKKFYYLIDLDPSFRLMTDDTEQMLLKEQAWNIVRDEYYQNNDQDFIELTKNFSKDRDDQGLQDLIYKLANFAITSPNSDEWLDSLSQLYQLNDDDFEKSNFYKEILLPNILQSLKEQLNLMKKAQSLALENESCAKYIDPFSEAILWLEDFIEKIGIYSFDDLATNISSFKFKTARKKPGTQEDEMTKVVQDIQTNIKDNFKKKILNDLVITNSENMTQIMNNSYKLIVKLVEAEKRYLEQFKVIKLHNKTLDFNDLEHFTMDIFKVEENGTRVAAEYYQNKFTEIMIDEYQDVNPMQESIVQSLQQNSNNFFMVGDIKQSIYGFRQAAPYLFAGKYDEFGRSNDTNELILLSNNFRSSKTVTSFVNNIFEMMMDNQVGGVDYDDRTKLIPGAKFPDNVDTSVEINIMDINSADEEGVNKRIVEITQLRSRIQKLVSDKYQIFDAKKGTNRDIRYSDIAILSRSKGYYTDIVSSFGSANIPVYVSDSQNYFQTMEVQVMIEILKLIDNPEQDIPLVAVLRSPIVGINENELAQIRIDNSGLNFYHTVLTYLENNDNQLTNKLEVFLKQLKNFREKANQASISELIWSIYQETGFLDFVTGMPGGKQRSANLHALYQRANEFEAMNFQGLFRFIRFIERIEANQKDLSQPSSIESDEDAVNVMTIHGSKGLEFPIVFLIDAAKKFNTDDLTGDALIDVQQGLGIKYIDYDRELRFSTPVRGLIKQKKNISNISEELRLLYVALTRAKQKLIIIGSTKSLSKKIEAWQTVDLTNSKIDLYDRLNFKSYLDIIMSCILQDSTSTSGSSFFNKELNTQILFIKPENIDLSIISPKKIFKIKNKPTADDKFTQTVKKILDFQYPYEKSVKTTAYQSVSEIKFLFGDPDEDSLVKSQIIDSGRYTLNDFQKPKFLMTEENVSGAEIGSATHLILQKLSLDQKPTIESVQKLINNLTNNGLISSAVSKKINILNIIDFFDSDLGMQVMNNRDTLQREYPFSMVVPAKKLFDSGSVDDDILIHGIIDGLIETKEGIIIFDYKTDNVINDNSAKNSVDSAVKNYSGQLNLYEAAIENIENKQVIGKYLYFLRLGKCVKI
ncbi:ATP-dependent helicase/nuclease subunit A [Companilactobacillus sp. RD055328]|uniref:helicase-exonuclease AddAB subunit AddA n=1 Tax=Companilactobacillus sp. RD055328 TaxID=2916634 RepID=UPI001FC7C342|nr:helicase-exonuclease AddAB subunit AddA [Companilactobacillus sp. RD055328]GKQ42680.1 ATP-dependent helicase/nuclease subunit A [Companilactobacillus sp. RD055328]